MRAWCKFCRSQLFQYADFFRQLKDREGIGQFIAALGNGLCIELAKHFFNAVGHYLLQANTLYNRKICQWKLCCTPFISHLVCFLIEKWHQQRCAASTCAHFASLSCTNHQRQCAFISWYRLTRLTDKERTYLILLIQIPSWICSTLT